MEYKIFRIVTRLCFTSIILPWEYQAADFSHGLWGQSETDSARPERLPLFPAVSAFFYPSFSMNAGWTKIKIKVMYRGNFKSPQKILKFIVAILKRSVFGGYLFNSHAQTTALISLTLIFQSFFELLLKLPRYFKLFAV